MQLKKKALKERDSQTCGKSGHLKKDCFEKGEAGSKTPGICPLCRNQCRSKYDFEGRPISGNRSRSTERHHEKTQIPQPQSGSPQTSAQQTSAQPPPQAAFTRPQAAVAGPSLTSHPSAGMDLATSNTVMLLDSSVHLIPTGVFGPPGQHTHALFVCSPWSY